MTQASVDVQNAEFIKLIVEKLKGDYRKSEVEDVIYGLVLAAHSLFKEGKSFNLSGIGQFRPIARPPSVRYNPMRGSAGPIKPFWFVAYKPDAYAKGAVDSCPLPDFMLLELQKLEEEWKEEMQRESETPIEDKPLPRTTLENKIRSRYNKSNKSNKPSNTKEQE